jgi:hypothetical protein
VLDSVIIVDNITGVLIPTQTMNVVRVQKNEPLPSDSPSKTYVEMKESGHVQRSSEDYIRRCRECNYYPFSIILNQSGRIEIVAQSYEVFKTWTTGINTLVKNKKKIPKMKTKLSSFR